MQFSLVFRGQQIWPKTSDRAGSFHVRYILKRILCFNRYVFWLISIEFSASIEWQIKPTLVLAEMGALFSSNKSTTASLPDLAAQWSGVSKSRVRQSITAPWFSSRFTMFALPHFVATWSGLKFLFYQIFVDFFFNLSFKLTFERIIDIDEIIMKKWYCQKISLVFSIQIYIRENLCRFDSVIPQNHSSINSYISASVLGSPQSSCWS